MKTVDVLRLGFHNINKNKMKTVLTSLIVFILSLLVMIIFYIGLSFKNNIEKIHKKYIELNENISISISGVIGDNIEDIISYSNGKVDYLYSSNYYGIYFDFKSEDIPFEISSGRLVENDYEVIVHESSEKELGDYIILNNENYKVVGIYSSEDFSNVIFDINYVYKRANITNINMVYEYNNKTFDKDINRLNKLVNKLHKIVPNSTISSYELDVYNKGIKHSFLVVGISFIIASIVFIITVGILSNSISILLDQFKDTNAIIKMMGGKKRTLFFISYVCVFVSIISGIIFAGIIQFAISPAFKFLKNIFNNVISDEVKNVVKSSYKYDTSSNIFVPLIVLVFYIIYSIIYLIILNKKIYNKNYYFKK